MGGFCFIQTVWYTKHMIQWLEDFKKRAEELKKERDKNRPVIKGVYRIHPPSDSPLRKKIKKNHFTC